MQGQCVCGAITIHYGHNVTDISACHCVTCVKWGGGPLFTFRANQSVELEPKADISIYASSEWAERGFCKHCGTHLFYRLKQNEEYYIPIALFDSAEPVALSSQIFIDQKPEYYHLPQSPCMMTGDDVFAAYASLSEDR